MSSLNDAPMKVSAKTQALMDKLHDKRWIKTFLSAKTGEDRLSLLRNYNIQTQEEESVIQYLVDRMAPPRASVTFESQVRFEMEEQAKDGDIIQDPQQEAYWETRLDEARKQDLNSEYKALEAHFSEISKIIPEITREDYFPSHLHVFAFPHKATSSPVQNPPEVTLSATSTVSEPTQPKPVEPPPGVAPGDEVVTSLKGISTASAERLNEAGIFTAKQFFALTYEQAVQILKTPLVAAKFKGLFATSPTPATI